MDRRDEFLMRMYEQIMIDINRHITVVWQSVATLAGSVAIFSLVKDQIVSIDVATSLIVLVCFWFLAHVYDASAWYNRNLVIVANIERDFLAREDLKNIHYYFGAHRKKGKMISHLQYQLYFGWGVLLLFIFFHIYQNSAKFSQPTNFQAINFLPILLSFIGVFFLFSIKAKDDRDYEAFIANSPGKYIDTTGIDFTHGHGR